MDFPLPLQMLPKRSSLGLFGPVKWDGELSKFGLGKFQLKEMALGRWKNETSIPEGLPKSILGNVQKLNTSSLDYTHGSFHLLCLHNSHLACREQFQFVLLVDRSGGENVNKKALWRPSSGGTQRRGSLNTEASWRPLYGGPQGGGKFK